MIRCRQKRACGPAWYGHRGVAARRASAKASLRQRVAPLAFTVGVLALLGLACSANPTDDETTGPGSTEETQNDELSTDGIVVVEDCSGALEDDDGLPCVGLVAGTPDAARAGVHQSAQEAVVDWADTNDAVMTELSAGPGVGDYLSDVDLLAERGYEVIVVLGSESGRALSSAPESHPDVRFIGVDEVEPDDAPNLAVVMFSDHEVGFLAGALAGLLTDSGDVVQILGSALVPPVSDLRDGFANGLAHTNSRADSEAFFHPGDPDVAVEDPTWGAATAARALEDGADVVFGTGGETGHGALVETAGRGGDAFCIAVDSDKWDVVPDAQPCLVTSVVKLVEPAVEDVLDSIADGDSPEGEIVGEVGYSDFHDFADVVPGEVQRAAEVVADQVRSGEVSTGRPR